MLNESSSTTNQTSQEREQRRQAILAALRREADSALEQLADQLVDLAEDKLFGQIEYTLRDIGHDFVSRAHQAGIEAGKKRGTLVPVAFAPTARGMPVSSTTDPKIG